MNKEKKRSALSKLLRYAGGHRFLTYVSWLLSAISAVLALMPFVFLWRIIMEVIAVNPRFDEAESIVTNGWLALGFTLLSMIVYLAALICSHLAAFRVAGNMKKAMLRHIKTLPIGFADRIGTGKVRRTVMEATAATETLLAHNLPDTAGGVATSAAMIALLFVFDWRFGAVSLLSMLLGVFAMSRMAGPRMSGDIRAYQNALENMSNEAVEYIRGIPVVKTFGQTVFSFHRFKKAIDDYGTYCVRYTTSCRGAMVAFTVLIHSSFAFITGLALVLLNGEAAEEILASFLFYVIFTPIIATTMNRLMFLTEGVMLINDAVRRVDYIMELKPLPKPLVSKKPKDASVELRDVTFRYGDSASAAVRHVSLSAAKNELVALVGPSGSGKTTLAALAARFFDAESGSVRVGGVDVREIDEETLMNTVSYVFQDSRLLKGTIAENLRLAKPDATDAELFSALKKAQCMDIIKKLPQGIDTVLGSEGTYLSGGEQQRVAVARALLKKAPVVLLDEATAFADPENEVLMQRAFTELVKDATVIVIAHRLSTIRGADRIYVLEEGRVVQEGRHEELCRETGLYRQMWDEYQTAANWKVGETA